MCTDLTGEQKCSRIDRKIDKILNVAIIINKKKSEVGEERCARYATIALTSAKKEIDAASPSRTIRSRFFPQ